MEMQLFLRQRLKRTAFYHKSSTEFHRLTLVEELKNDDKEEVVCLECKEPAVVGPTLKCMACQYLCHVSCRHNSTLCFHFGRRHDDDQLIFTEELKNDDGPGKEGVVCMVCVEQVEGPGYKCSASECNFRFHKSCAQLPRQIHHPSHLTHILILQLPSTSSSLCNACGKWCFTCLFYRCNECNFNLDIPCATRTRIDIKTHDCQHTFVPFFKQIHFTCEACGQEDKGFASFCTICQFFIHSKCAGLPRTIYISIHNHSLTLIYSLHNQVEHFNSVFCNLCGEKVKTEYAAFSCQECRFAAHLYCAEAYRVPRLHYDWLPEKSVDAVEKINPGEIQHFSHLHNLNLSHEEVLHDKLCDGCMHFIISAPFYNCTQCNFFLHTTCAQLPKKENHILHRHRLTLFSKGPYNSGLFICNTCGHTRHGFTYRCDRCNYDLDLKCFSIPKTLKHEGHQHSLILAVSSDKNCNACDSIPIVGAGVFVCSACDFTLGFECATLPHLARHKYDEHSLALTYVAEDNSKEYYCLICERERDPKHWFYYCAKCDFSAHPQCVLGKDPYIKFGTTYKNKNHRHPVTFVQKTEYSPSCHGCGKTFDGMALQCTQCKFNVHHKDECLQKVNKVLHP